MYKLTICGFYFGNRTGNDNLQTSPDGVNPITETFARLDIGADVDEKMEIVVEHHPVSGVVECKCGMPLCICEAPAPAPAPFTDARPLPVWILQEFYVCFLHFLILTEYYF